jgi:hypothetical protein
MSTLSPPQAAGEEQARGAMAGAITVLEAAEAAFASGLDAVPCAPVLRAAFSPDVPTLAQVLAAVWLPAMTKSNRSLLAKALTDAYPQAPPEEITLATYRAMTRARGIYLRKALDDGGTIPYVGPNSRVSPDIVPAGTSAIPDPQAYFRESWNRDPGTTIRSGATNYVYVRGMNHFPGAEDGEVHLYWCRATTLPMPSVWGRQPVPNQAGATAPAKVSAAATGDVVVGRTPFLWTGPTDGALYTLIARVVTRYDPNPIPTDSTYGGTWFVDHPGFAQRSVGLAAAGALQPRTHRVGFGSPDSAPGRFLVVADCRGLTGAAVSLASRGEVAFDTGPRGIPAGGGQVEVAAELPPGYDGDLEVGIGPDGSGAEASARPGAGVEVRLYQLVAPEHEASVFARLPEEPGIRHAGPVGEGAQPVFLGSFLIRFD